MLSLFLDFKNPHSLQHVFLSAHFGFQLNGEDDHYSSFVLTLIKLSNNVFHILKSWILTLDIILAIHFHPLSTLATCVIIVHIVGDFCHITCLSNPFYCTRHLVPRKTCKFRLSWNSTKFNVVDRFRETIPTVKSVSSSEI